MSNSKKWNWFLVLAFSLAIARDLVLAWQACNWALLDELGQITNLDFRFVASCLINLTTTFVFGL
jgi:hypothetical protein